MAETANVPEELVGERAHAASPEALLNLATEGWRFARTFVRVLTKLDAGDAQRYAGQVRYYLKSIEDNLQASDLTLVNLEGQPYDEGIAASAINIGDFDPNDILIVDQMVEPIIMGKNGVVRPGTVLVRKI